MAANKFIKCSMYVYSLLKNKNFVLIFDICKIKNIKKLYFSDNYKSYTIFFIIL